jgi:hypothetical protein
MVPAVYLAPICRYIGAASGGSLPAHDLIQPSIFSASIGKSFMSVWMYRPVMAVPVVEAFFPVAADLFQPIDASLPNNERLHHVDLYRKTLTSGKKIAPPTGKARITEVWPPVWT